MIIVFIALAGAAGACVRGLIGHGMSARLPWGTLVVNLLASFGLGLATAWDGPTATIASIGALGALSTWSSLAYELDAMVRRHEGQLAAAYLLISITGGIGMAWLGIRLVG